MRIAILLLNNFGDVLYATPVAKQIKEIDFPGSELTWIVSQQCSPLLNNHPFVDQLEIVELKNFAEVNSPKWEEIYSRYQSELANHKFDRLFVLQPIRKNLTRYRNSIRQMILDAYPIKMKISVQPIIALTEQEVAQVASFVEKNKIQSYKNRILFEFAPKSGQSSLTVEKAIQLAKDIVISNSSTCVILSSNLDLNLDNEALFNAKELSFKENAELINSCTLLIGCSSGLSWLSSSNWCKPIDTIQYLNLNVPWFNSLKADFIQNGISTGQLLEMYKFNYETLLNCVQRTLNENFSVAKMEFDQDLPEKFGWGNLRTVAAELAYYTPNYYIGFVLKNLNKGVFMSGHYLKLLSKFSYQYFKLKIKTFS